jgi:hypothetical protein
VLLCQTCSKPFATFHALSSHLSYSTSRCKIDIKEYYDKYLRTFNEGICKLCGHETKFSSLTKGYPSNICSKCNKENKNPDKNIKRSASLKLVFNKKRKLHQARKNLINLLRKRTIQSNKKQCQICGIIFPSYHSLSSHLRIHNIYLKNYYDCFFKLCNEEKCLCCQSSTNFISLKKGYSDYCSPKCACSSPLVKNIKEQNSIILYGVSSPLKNQLIHQKQIKGIQNAIKLKGTEILNKRRNTCLQRYGVDSVTQTESFKKKVKYKFQIFKNSNEYKQKKQEQHQTFLKNTFYPRLKLILETQNFEMLDPYQGADLKYHFKCLKCGSIFYILWNSLQQGKLCQTCNQGKSKAEIEITTFIKSLGLNPTENDRETIKPYELDLYFPDKNIAIEYCGLYFHSELNLQNPKQYHINKLQLCRNKDIQLIHIFEDEWLFKQEIVKHRLMHILGKNSAPTIFARKCLIHEIKNDKVGVFLDEFHIQGKDQSRIKLGAFYNDILVAVMTFGTGNISKGKKHKEGIWELNRFCANHNYRVVAIAEKLLTYFIRNYSWKEIYSYADLRWSTGNLYKKLGFNLLYETNPNYWYIKNYKRIHRFNLRKRPDEPKDIPEWQLRANEGYYRIWDCGHLKFSLENTDKKIGSNAPEPILLPLIS